MGEIWIGRVVRVVLFNLLIAATAGTSLAETLSLIELNTWGVPFAVKDKWRYRAAMNAIAELSPDLVVLEEVFTVRGQCAFKHPDYPYHVTGPRFFPRLVGSGLRILSKHPIERKASLVYRSCTAEDCLARKGALLAVVDLPNGTKLTVVTTHLNARGDDETRADQLLQLKEFIDDYREPGSPLVVSGDFNFTPDSALYPTLLQNLGLVDAWTVTHPTGDPGYTDDNLHNHYGYDYSIAHHFPLVQERIDYAFTSGLKPVTSEVIFNSGTLYSDHYGVRATFELPSEELAEAGD